MRTNGDQMIKLGTRSGGKNVPDFQRQFFKDVVWIGSQELDRAVDRSNDLVLDRDDRVVRVSKSHRRERRFKITTFDDRCFFSEELPHRFLAVRTAHALY